MKVVNTGNRYVIYDDSLKTFDKISAGTYVVCFDKNSGFFLRSKPDMQINETVYGQHTDKINKVMSSFERFSRNLGIILSGDKGIGKSMFARMLSVECIRKDMPVIIVDSFIPNIAAYIESIDQEVMILFDEFDKTFAKCGSDGEDPQATMLSLFDGTSNGKKMFVVTCNSLNMLNDFLVNRPGRFHYLDFCKQIKKSPEVPHVRIVNGDLLDTEEGIIVHQVNCKHRMRSGIAKQIRDKYPTHYFDYMNTEPILGNVCLSKIDEKLYVAGVFGQDNYGYTKDVVYTDYEKLREGLLGINSVAEMYGLQVYLPYKIGCGLANGDWDTVFKIIQDTIPDAIVVRKD